MGDPENMKYPYLLDIPAEVLIGPKTSKRSLASKLIPYSDHPLLENM